MLGIGLGFVRKFLLVCGLFLGGILRSRSLWVVVAWMYPCMYVRLIVGGRSK